jgi:hypothetical protein
MDNYTQIYLKDYGYLDVSQDIQIPLNYSLAEVKDISKRNSSYSKTIVLPGTKNNNEKLGMIFDVNVRFNDCTFKINRKVQAVIFQNGQPVLSGWFKLININKLSPSDISFDENIEYECVVFSNQTGIYDRIKDLDISQLNFSAYNHTLSFSAITGSSLNTYDDVYKYIWHYTSNDKYDVGDFRPAIFVKAIWDKIFQDAGFSYSGSFPTRAPFSKLLIPSSSKSLLLTDAEIAKREFRASFSSGYSVNNINTFTKTPQLTITSGFQLFGVNEPVNISTTQAAFSILPFALLRFNDDTTGANFDGAYDNYNPTTFTFTARKTGQYEMDINLAGKIRLTFPESVFYPERVFGLNRNDSRLVSDMGEPTIGYTTEIFVTPASGGTAYLANSFFKKYPILGTAAPVPQYYGTGTQPTWASGTTSYDYTFVIPKFLLNLNVGDRVNIRFKIVAYKTSFATTTYYTNVFQRNKAAQYNVTINSYNDTNSFWRVRSVKNNLTNGDEVDLSQMLPQKIKQFDFIKSIVNMFNLYLIPDENDANNIIIKTRDEYYADFQNQYVDWTDKIDYSQNYKLQLLSELQNKTLNFTYKTANDEVNKKYFDETGFLYGQYRLNFDNDFLNGEQKIEVMFEPTPLVKTMVPLGDEGFTFIVPYLVYGVQQNPKILYDGGSISVSGYTIMDGATPRTLNYYNYAGHFDNPTNPNIDINWNTNEYYFYNEVVENLTDNTLFNEYWFKYVQLISESKLLTAYFDLNEYDIASLNFAKLVWIRDSYWYLNRVIDYDATNPKLTKVELIKSLEYPKFNKKKITKPPRFVDVETITPWATIKGVRQSDNFQAGLTNNNNYGSNSTIIGFNNNILTDTKNSRIHGNVNTIGSASRNVIIDGDNNFVGGGSQRVYISGNNNQIFGGSIDVSLTNCNNLTLVNCVGNISLTNVDNQIIDLGSTKTFISEFIYIQDGISINNSQIVDGGLDITYLPKTLNVFVENLIDAGENIVYVFTDSGADVLNGTIDGIQIDYENILYTT